MRVTGKEIIDFCESYLKSRGEKISDMSKGTNINKAVFSMWKSHPDTVPKLDAIVAISEYTGLTVGQIIGQDKMSYPQEITTILNMLLNLPQISLKAITSVVKTYYDADIEDKRKQNVI